MLYGERVQCTRPSRILLRGDASANFIAHDRRGVRASCMRAIVRHYVRVPINESRLCCLTMNVPVVSGSSGRPTRCIGAAEEVEEEIAVKGRNYCDYYRTPKSTKLHERSCLRWCLLIFYGRCSSYITLCRDFVRREDESRELNFN